MPRNDGILLKTTTVPVGRTRQELEAVLLNHGARAIETDYDDRGLCSAMRFRVLLDGELTPYRLPVRTEPLFMRIHGERKGAKAKFERVDREQAERIAWRQLLIWVKAQFAMIDIRMVKQPEVFFPYMVTPFAGQTLFEIFEARGFKMLAAPEQK